MRGLDEGEGRQEKEEEGQEAKGQAGSLSGHGVWYRKNVYGKNTERGNGKGVLRKKRKRSQSVCKRKESCLTVQIGTAIVRWDGGSGKKTRLRLETDAVVFIKGEKVEVSNCSPKKARFQLQRPPHSPGPSS